MGHRFAAREMSDVHSVHAFVSTAAGPLIRFMGTTTKKWMDRSDHQERKQVGSPHGDPTCDRGSSTEAAGGQTSLYSPSIVSPSSAAPSAPSAPSADAPPLPLESSGDPPVAW